MHRHIFFNVCTYLGLYLDNKIISTISKISTLPLMKRGRLGNEKVQLYLMSVRAAGGVVSTRIAIAAARGFVQHFKKQILLAGMWY